MKISYEFEGHDLTRWAEYGGLPAYDTSYNQRCRIIYCLSIEGRECVHVHLEGPSTIILSRDEIKLRFSTLEDVINQKFDRARWFFVSPSGCGFFSYQFPRIWRKKVEPSKSFGEAIKGHLFDPTKYPEPIRIER